MTATPPIKKSLFVAALTACMLLSACAPNAKEKQVIHELTTNMRPICMGRFVMDIPQGMDNALGHVKLYYGLDKNFKTVMVHLENADTTPQQMAESVAAQAADIARKQNRETQKSMLLEHKVINDHMIYLRYHSSLGSATSRKRELHVLIGKTSIKLFAKSYEGLKPAPDFPREPGEKVDERLFRLASQIRAVDDPEQAGAGFCMGDVVIDADHDEEDASLFFPMKRHPDLLFTINTKALTPGSEYPPLLERMREMDKRLDVSGLRKGEMTLGGMQAHEWLASAENDRDNKLLLFTAQSMRSNPAFARPQMSFTMKTGGQLRDGSGAYVDSSLTPAEGVAMWDAMIQSVRPRPHAVK